MTISTGSAKARRKEFQRSRLLEGRIMKVQQDFKELLELLNEQKVKYIIVGSYALAFHGAPFC